MAIVAIRRAANRYINRINNYDQAGAGDVEDVAPGACMLF
jgi:hypothetical protein